MSPSTCRIGRVPVDPTSPDHPLSEPRTPPRCRLAVPLPRALRHLVGAVVALLVFGTAAAAQLEPPAQSTYRGILVVGQSNMVGGNLGPRDSAPGGLDDLPTNVYCFDRSDRVAPWHLPFPFELPGEESGTSANVNAAMSFAKRMGEEFPGDRFCVVFCAQNASGFNALLGEPLRSWAAPASPNHLAGNLFDRTVTRCAAAAAQGVEFEWLVGILGESDANVMTQAELGDEFRWLVEGLRTEVGPLAAVFGMMPQWDGTVFGDLSGVDAVLDVLAATVPDVVLAPADGLVQAPVNINHFSGPSCRIHGERMVDALLGAGLIGPAEPSFGTPFHSPAPLGLAGGAGGSVGVILHQDFLVGRWFESFTDVLAGGDAVGGQFSRLIEFERFRRRTGEFVLRVEWGNGEHFTWSQTSNPLVAPRDVVTGFTVIDDPLGLAGAGLVGGLCRTSASGALLSLRPGAITIDAPLLALYRYNDYEFAQLLGVADVLQTPTGQSVTRVTLEAL